jgi:glycine reductase
MAKEFDRMGIPAVQICTILPIAQTVGSNRIVKAVAIPYPVGNPTLSLEDEKILRYEIMEKAIQSLETDINEQTIF